MGTSLKLLVFKGENTWFCSNTCYPLVLHKIFIFWLSVWPQRMPTAFQPNDFNKMSETSPNEVNRWSELNLIEYELRRSSLFSIKLSLGGLFASFWAYFTSFLWKLVAESTLKGLNLCFNIMNVKLCLLNQEFGAHFPSIWAISSHFVSFYWAQYAHQPQYSPYKTPRKLGVLVGECCD